MVKWTDEDICSFYDLHPDLTLQQLALITHKTVNQLKKILMSG